MPSERMWISYADHRSLPRQTRRDAILMESEDQWRDFQRNRDSVHQPSGRCLVFICRNECESVNAPMYFTAVLMFVSFLVYSKK